MGNTRAAFYSPWSTPNSAFYSPWPTPTLPPPYQPPSPLFMSKIDSMLHQLSILPEELAILQASQNQTHSNTASQPTITFQRDNYTAPLSIITNEAYPHSTQELISLPHMDNKDTSLPPTSLDVAIIHPGDEKSSPGHDYKGLTVYITEIPEFDDATENTRVGVGEKIEGKAAKTSFNVTLGKKEGTTMKSSGRDLGGDDQTLTNNTMFDSCAPSLPIATEVLPSSNAVTPSPCPKSALSPVEVDAAKEFELGDSETKAEGLEQQQAEGLQQQQGFPDSVLQMVSHSDELKEKQLDWEYGVFLEGLQLNFHLEDKVNFQGGNIDTDPTMKPIRLYARRPKE